jgi:hypothetical protein
VKAFERLLGEGKIQAMEHAFLNRQTIAANNEETQTLL